ncbi:unnamed protein product [Paramecium sonneborni]|uniref:PHD-type domain-containing protein n=1 Tax=Paramecium sonneborni TaxID=65129 RepID=A0A8S1LHV1_9CILI|nr:unnamed protein product [Paramecium sonneborni]
MNSGLNNQNSLLQQLTPAQLEEYQQQFRQQQLLNTFLNFKPLGFPSLFQQFQDNVNRTPQALDLLNINFGLGNALNSLDYSKILQKSLQMTNQASLNPFLTSQLFYQVGLGNQKNSNNIHNPITVEDDEPQQVQKCHNQKCNNKGDRKAKSKKGDSIQFCEKCLRLYTRGNYCDFCEQLYSNGANDQDEQEWIQCDICEKWNHLNCEAKFRNQNIREETENKVYHCLNCSKTIKKQQQQTNSQQQQKKQEKSNEEYQPKQRQIIECEDNRIREKNINFVATKDNKVQFTFRFNLCEDEIKQDLDYLRNAGKKMIKKQNLVDSPQMKINSIPQQQQQQQEEKNVELQVNSRLRTRPNNKNKVNYRYLGGE